VDAPHWLHELRAELARRKLPPLYVERFVLEMSDHFSDCMEDRMSTDAKDLHGVFQRLGTPGDVARSAAHEFRQARFSRRHPVLMFVVLPVLLVPVLWMASIMAVVMLLELLGIESGKVVSSSTTWQIVDACLPYAVLALLLIPAAMSATFFAYLAKRAEVHWKWLGLACLLVAMLGGLAALDVMLPTANDQGRLAFGFSLSKHPSASQLLQFLLPLAIGGWAVWRQMGYRDGTPQHG
jgi:hypothetical protein